MVAYFLCRKYSNKEPSKCDDKKLSAKGNATMTPPCYLPSSCGQLQHHHAAVASTQRPTSVYSLTHYEVVYPQQ